MLLANGLFLNVRSGFELEAKDGKKKKKSKRRHFCVDDDKERT